MAIGFPGWFVGFRYDIFPVFKGYKNAMAINFSQGCLLDLI
jgi:hypothetical protein